MLVVNRQQFQDKTVLSVPTRTRQFLNFILNTCAVFNTRGGTNHAFRRLLNRINGSGTNEKVGTSRVQKLPIGIKLPDPFGPLDPGEKVEQGRQKGSEKPPTNTATSLVSVTKRGSNSRQKFICVVKIAPTSLSTRPPPLCIMFLPIPPQAARGDFLENPYTYQTAPHLLYKKTGKVWGFGFRVYHHRRAPRESSRSSRPRDFE
jgi:hypothetical protein